MTINNMPQQQSVTISTDNLKTVECVCGECLFESVFTYKIVPALYSRTGKSALVGLQCLRCITCGKITSVDMILNDTEK